MATKPSYVELISEFWPNIQVQSSSGPFDYAAIQLIDPTQTLPTQAELDSKSLYSLRKTIWKEIQARRDYRKGAGVKIGANWFHSDDTSRIQQLALTMMGANIPAGINWKTMQGTFVVMTPTLASQMFQTIAGSDQAIFSKAEFHRQTMIGLTEPELYDYTTGWAMIYEESPECAALVDYQ